MCLKSFLLKFDFEIKISIKICLTFVTMKNVWKNLLRIKINIWIVKLAIYLNISDILYICIRYLLYICWRYLYEIDFSVMEYEYGRKCIFTWKKPVINAFRAVSKNFSVSKNLQLELFGQILKKVDLKAMNCLKRVLECSVESLISIPINQIFLFFLFMYLDVLF